MLPQFPPDALKWKGRGVLRFSLFDLRKITLAIGAAPAVELLCAPAAERLPVALGTDDSYGFDRGLARRGWVAVQVYRQVVALRDGELLRPVRLRDAYTVRRDPHPGRLS